MAAFYPAGRTDRAECGAEVPQTRRAVGSAVSSAVDAPTRRTPRRAPRGRRTRFPFPPVPRLLTFSGLWTGSTGADAADGTEAPLFRSLPLSGSRRRGP